MSAIYAPSINRPPRTNLSYPLSVVVDTKNRELWVANLGNSSATVYPLTASGDVLALAHDPQRARG